MVATNGEMWQSDKEVGVKDTAVAVVDVVVVSKVFGYLGPYSLKKDL